MAKFIKFIDHETIEPVMINVDHIVGFDIKEAEEDEPALIRMLLSCGTLITTCIGANANGWDRLRKSIENLRNFEIVDIDIDEIS